MSKRQRRRVTIRLRSGISGDYDLQGLLTEISFPKKDLLQSDEAVVPNGHALEAAPQILNRLARGSKRHTPPYHDARNPWHGMEGSSLWL
jgi:hypothetical protein